MITLKMLWQLAEFMAVVLGASLLIAGVGASLIVLCQDLFKQGK